MKELSLHILDVVQNSLGAKASLVEIDIVEDVKNDLLTIKIKDNGTGMDEEMSKKVIDPFFTTRTTRRVGMGIPLFAQAAKSCGGDLKVYSEKGKGTEVIATFVLNHIDRAPIGSMADTMVSLVAVHPDVDFIYRHCVGDKAFVLDTREVKKILQEVPINNPMVLDWIKRFIQDNLKEINGGA
ncbi:MAG: sensor histidine kinase [Tepidanaerobacter acetatoxydans]|uniref:ATP-binding protein n=1 Tax=Tepidanaerobacter acetatoxydans TaxID=499229 RepID=UPI0026EF62FB|nr:ATP-binding protein [Tepidanaerobacter acetatoxydans]NLU11050.1 sensor histidine kinase [Tepidanaerobacter acetatoxydans]